VRGWGRVLSRCSSCVSAEIHMAVAEREAEEPVREHGTGLECQRVHMAVAKRGTKEPVGARGAGLECQRGG
jgi:hypothetical protein